MNRCLNEREKREEYERGIIYVIWIYIIYISNMLFMRERECRREERVMMRALREREKREYIDNI